MTGSRQIAGLLGPTMIAIAITEALNLRIMASPPPSIGVVYMNGTLLFVAGLAIVRGHNRSPGSWPILVTLVGWLAMLAGLVRMFAPASAESGAPWVYGLLIILLGVGILLTFKAYAREKAPHLGAM